jgi:hypothetical protein
LTIRFVSFLFVLLPAQFLRFAASLLFSGEEERRLMLSLLHFSPERLFFG